jgi:hypothetical protein
MASWTVIIVGFIVLIVIVIGSPSHPVYDEDYYLATVDVLEHNGLSVAFLREFPGPAGPTFTVVFALVSSTFGLGLPWLRLVNVGLMAGSAVLLYGTFRAKVERRSQFKTPPALVAGTLTVLPTIGVSAGMTLTEMPALFFVSAFLFAAARIDPDAEPHAAGIMSAVASGFALGAAVLGRQNYLLILPCLALLTDWHNGAPRRGATLVLVLIFISAVVTVAPVFMLWGGLVPPAIARVGRGLSVWHGILGAGYAGIIVALIAPDVYRPLISRSSWPLAILFLAIGLAFFVGAPTRPMSSVVSLFGPMISQTSETGFTFLICLSAVAFLAAMALHLRSRWDDRLVRFCGCVVLAELLSNMKITHQFSSRYVAVSLPFLIASFAGSIRMSWHFPIRLAICACVSLASLVSYLYE